MENKKEINLIVTLYSISPPKALSKTLRTEYLKSLKSDKTNQKDLVKVLGDLKYLIEIGFVQNSEIITSIIKELENLYGVNDLLLNLVE